MADERVERLARLLAEEEGARWDIKDRLGAHERARWWCRAEELVDVTLAERRALARLDVEEG